MHPTRRQLPDRHTQYEGHREHVVGNGRRLDLLAVGAGRQPDAGCRSLLAEVG